MDIQNTFQSFKSFKSRLAKFSYFGAMVGGVSMLALRLPGGTVLFGFVSLYVLRGLVAALLLRGAKSPQG